jgi:hypothetical protein
MVSKVSGEDKTSKEGANLASEGVHAFAFKAPSSFMEMFLPFSKRGV